MSTPAHFEPVYVEAVPSLTISEAASLKTEIEVKEKDHSQAWDRTTLQNPVEWCAALR